MLTTRSSVCGPEANMQFLSLATCVDFVYRLIQKPHPAFDIPWSDVFLV